MQKFLLLIVLALSLLQAESYREAKESCGAYNDLKHRQNSAHQKLKVGERYRILREQNDHYYVTIPGVTVPNRWVEKHCFAKEPAVEPAVINTQVSDKKAEKKYDSAKHTGVVKPTHLLLALSWQNAFCETHRSRRECRQGRKGQSTDNHFVLHGLWPQPRNNEYCNISQNLKQLDKNKQWSRLPKLSLSDETRNTLLTVMPGSASNLHRHEWIKHGTCSGSNPETYFKEAISLTQQFGNSKVGTFFADNLGRVVTLKQVRAKVDESFGRGSGNKVELRCNKGMITEVWLHLGNRSSDLSTLLKKGKNVNSRCRKGRIDRAGFR